MPTELNFSKKLWEVDAILCTPGGKCRRAEKTKNGRAKHRYGSGRRKKEERSPIKEKREEERREVKRGVIMQQEIPLKQLVREADPNRPPGERHRRRSREDASREGDGTAGRRQDLSARPALIPLVPPSLDQNLSPSTACPLDPSRSSSTNIKQELSRGSAPSQPPQFRGECHPFPSAWRRQ